MSKDTLEMTQTTRSNPKKHTITQNEFSRGRITRNKLYLNQLLKDLTKFDSLQTDMEFSSLKEENGLWCERLLERVEHDFGKLSRENFNLMERLKGVVDNLRVFQNLRRNLKLKSRQETQNLVEKANRLKVENFLYHNLLQFLEGTMSKLSFEKEAKTSSLTLGSSGKM